MSDQVKNKQANPADENGAELSDNQLADASGGEICTVDAVPAVSMSPTHSHSDEREIATKIEISPSDDRDGRE